MTYFSPTVGSAYGKIVTGTVTVSSAGTAQQVTATNTPIGGVWVAADLGTGIPMVVGGANVSAASGSTQGIILTPGNNSVFVAIDNLNLLYVDAETNNGKLSYAYLQPFWDNAA